MFNSFSNNLSSILDKIKGRGHLSEEDINSAAREIRVALLEADVSLIVANQFMEHVKEKALGQEILKSIMPGQMVVKIVHDELIELLGGVSVEEDGLNKKKEVNKKKELDKNDALDKKKIAEKKIAEREFDYKKEFKFPKKGLFVLMMVGLQGSGKTTTTAKLALRLKQKHNKKVIVASTDIYRPGAQLQLETLAKQINIKSLEIINGQNPTKICKRALDEAKKDDVDVLIIDTAGRLHTDKDLMNELDEIKKITSPTEIFLVSDAMIGQESATTAKEFHDKLKLSGVILTRVDGDARGGAALSMKVITGCPIKFVGVGEKINEFEVFYADRAASKILNMGDIVSLVEKTAEIISEEEAEKLAKKMEKGHFDMNDLLKQMESLKKMGNISSIMGMLPGVSKLKEKMDGHSMDSALIKNKAAIMSMTYAERYDPSIINASRKKRIAEGSGTDVATVNVLLKQFFDMKFMIKKLMGVGISGVDDKMKKMIENNDNGDADGSNKGNSDNVDNRSGGGMGNFRDMASSMTGLFGGKRGKDRVAKDDIMSRLLRSRNKNKK